MPPILIVHGDKDTLVPLAQAQTFADGLKTAGINATLCVTAGRGHGDVMDDAAKTEVIAFSRNIWLESRHRTVCNSNELSR